MNLHPLDWVILAAYLVGIVAIGLWQARGAKTTDDFFLAGRKLGWFVVGNALFAANISSEQFVGQAGNAYKNGLLIGNWQWIGAITLALFGVTLVPVYVRARLTTIPEYVERRYGVGCRIAVSSVNLLVLVFVKLALTLHAGGTLLATLIGPEWYSRGLWVLGIGAGAYTIVGGLRSAAITETIQSGLLILSGVLVTTLGLVAIGGPHALVEKVGDPSAFTLIRPASDRDFPWPAFFTAGTIVSFYYWGMDMEITQRVLGARDLRNGRLGVVFAGFLKVLALFVIVLPGLIARVYLRERGVVVANMDEAYPTMIRTLLPIGVAGLCLAGLLAASMSTLDSVLCATSSLFINDFVRRWRRGVSDRALLFVGRATMVVGLLFAIGWAPRIREAPHGMFAYLVNVFIFVAPPIVACFLFGVFWRGATRAGAAWCLALGLPTGLAFVLQNGPFGENAKALVSWLPAWPQLYESLVVAGVSSTALIVASLFSRSAPAPVDPALFFHRAEGAECERDVPMWRRSTFWTVVLLSTMAVLYAIFG
ncbi:MAG: sodium/solute symporter [Planctomycetes bacterium]|nr:sodium/solute symporter [Planctomycetota bacterium]MBI3843362.1 sodium/solute symporter [Planctomycetota bacterium]